MKIRSGFLAAAAALLLTATLHGQSTPPAIVLEEYRMIIRALRSENEQLRERNELLANELVRLRLLLEETQTAPREAAAAEAEEAEAEPGFALQYVNATWHYVLVEAGEEAGLRTGMRGRIFRDGVEMAEVLLTHVKSGQSVGDLNVDSLRDDGRYPRAGDRVLFLTQPAAEVRDE